MFENNDERRLREMREIEMMLEQARVRAAMQKINEKRTSIQAISISGAAVGGGSLAVDSSENQYVENDYIDDYFE